MYTVTAICDNIGIAKPTFYRLLRENTEFQSVVNADRKTKGNGFVYGETVFNWLNDRYGKSQKNNCDQPVEKIAPKNSEEIKILEQKVEELQRRLEAAEYEKKQLFESNCQLLMLLSQEKQEKQLLLPAPKMSLGQRIAKFIKKEAQSNGNSYKE